jgi:inosine-uridine nucleoside N-ribohydrolase
LGGGGGEGSWAYRFALAASEWSGGGGGGPAGFQSIGITTDLDSDIDDVTAIALAIDMAETAGVDLSYVIVGSANDYSAHCARVLLDEAGYTDTPVGQIVTPPEANSTSLYAQTVAELQTPVVLRSGYPDAATVMRTALAGMPDGSHKIISMGCLTEIEALLSSAADGISPLTGSELMADKVISIDAMGGRFPTSSTSESNVQGDEPAANYVAANTPVPIYWATYGAGNDVNHTLPTAGYSGQGAYKKAWQAYGVSSRPSWDLISVINAIEPDAGLFTTSEAGNVTFNAGTAWTANASGKNYYLTKSVAASVVQDYINTRLASFMVKYGTPDYRALYLFNEGSGQIIDQSGNGNDSTSNTGTWQANGLYFPAGTMALVPNDNSLEVQDMLLIIVATFASITSAEQCLASMDGGANDKRAWQKRKTTSATGNKGSFFHRYSQSTSITELLTPTALTAGTPFLLASRLRPDRSMNLYNEDYVSLASATLGGATPNSGDGCDLAVGSRTGATNSSLATLHYFALAAAPQTPEAEAALIAKAVEQVSTIHGIAL